MVELMTSSLVPFYTIACNLVTIHYSWSCLTWREGQDSGGYYDIRVILIAVRPYFVRSHMAIVTVQSLVKVYSDQYSSTLELLKVTDTSYPTTAGKATCMILCL